MENTLNLGSVVAEYKPIIAKFKKRADVQNGNALGYREGQSPTGRLLFENQPKTIGQGLSTTGWCVSASQALLLDSVFQYFITSRGANAQLVSIDIKEQYYGNCYNGSQNKWHTAILVYDSGLYFIIDITCAQFGNNFVGKDVWEFKTWESTFRSLSDQHKITGFNGEDLNFTPVFLGRTSKLTREMEQVTLVQHLKSITTISDPERDFLADFFLTKINQINHKLEVGNITTTDYKYIDKINYLLKNFEFKEIPLAYCVMTFQNKDVFKKWLISFINGDKILKGYTMFSPTIEEACILAQINPERLFNSTSKSESDVYLVFELHNVSSFAMVGMQMVNMLIPHGVKLDFENGDMYNGNQTQQPSIGRGDTTTNTVIIKCK